MTHDSVIIHIVTCEEIVCYSKGVETLILKPETVINLLTNAALSERLLKFLDNVEKYERDTNSERENTPVHAPNTDNNVPLFDTPANGYPEHWRTVGSKNDMDISDNSADMDTKDSKVLYQALVLIDENKSAILDVIKVITKLRDDINRINNP